MKTYASVETIMKRLRMQGATFYIEVSPETIKVMGDGGVAGPVGEAEDLPDALYKYAVKWNEERYGGKVSPPDLSEFAEEWNDAQ